jgi:hypothetical protein
MANKNSLARGPTLAHTRSNSTRPRTGTSPYDRHDVPRLPPCYAHRRDRSLRDLSRNIRPCGQLQYLGPRPGRLIRPFLARDSYNHPHHDDPFVRLSQSPRLSRAHAKRFSLLTNVFRMQTVVASVAAEIGAFFVLMIFWLAIGANVSFFAHAWLTYQTHDFADCVKRYQSFLLLLLQHGSVLFLRVD